MALSPARRTQPPLDQERLEELALRYVAKYATSGAKLCTYLARKLRERGWIGDDGPDLQALAGRFAQLGYIDDPSYAVTRSRALSARGYGKRRLVETLRRAGVSEDDSRAAFDAADLEAVDAALRFARRRRLGPFAPQDADRHQREKWIAAMIRAGHTFGLARAIASLAPGAAVDPGELSETIRLDAN
ncbi:MAG TPA: RecX family transcriptional regulator [Sphingomicrobium sp.]